MPLPSGLFDRCVTRVRQGLVGPPALAFLPALTLAAYWLGGEGALLGVALAVPVILALLGNFHPRAGTGDNARDSVTGLLLRSGFDARVHKVFQDTALSGQQSACFVLDVADISQLSDRHGQIAADTVALHVAEKIRSVLHNRGVAARLGDSRFAICLHPVQRLDLEMCIQMAGALHSAVEEAVQMAGSSMYICCNLGFCQRSQITGENPQTWLTAATEAMVEARVVGPSVIRAYSAELQRKSRTRADLRSEAAAALENGQIQPWYQPQISTDTGKVTGFEALARWTHPVHGMIAPDMFLPIMEEAGLLERLGEVMLYHAMTALKAWDGAGIAVPRVGVNFAGDELRNPRLVDKIKWELDRFDLAADRLSVEILETVVTDAPNDIVTRNIAGLAALGCRIDLDDFGTGHASIASVRKFSISRIKIDRSFVIKADRDAQQQRLVGAILTMAERLGLETLAEGVETVGEHALLAQLGCDHVQGFGIGRPMPFEQTLDWTMSHEAKLQDAPQITRGTG